MIKLILKIMILLFLFNSHKVTTKDIFSNIQDYKKTKTKFYLKEITKGINHPWGITFINDEDLLVTEKNGKLIKINTKTGKKIEIKHDIQNVEYKKKFFGSAQGGLLDILYNKDFVYFSYSHINDNNEDYSTAIARGKLLDDRIKEFEILLIAKPGLMTNIHWGSRIAIKGKHLYAGFGERGLGMIAQNPKKHPGSIIRINVDGSIPKNNPKFENRPNWLPEIFQIGIRNPQGITISPHDDEIYFSQHGPRGGDNIGKVKSGGNFGWKNIAWGGTEYTGKKIGNNPFNSKYDKPIISWVPSIGVGNIDFYEGKTFSEWNGDLIVCATKENLLLRLIYQNNKIINKEIILQNEVGRIRDFEIDSKGNIYLIIDDENSSLWKLSK